MRDNVIPSSNQLVTLSIVIPLYNEREVLPALYHRLMQVLFPIGIPFQIVFVDDGSKDGSGHYLAKLAAHNPRIKVVRLSRNFGKEAALSAGLAQADGEAVVVLDADLQDPPELIPSMLEAWRRGAEIVAMKRRHRTGETWLKKKTAHWYYRLLQKLSPVMIPEDTGDFRLMSRRVVDAINALPERNRYMKGLFAWVGYHTEVIEYDRAPRVGGRTKWGFGGLFSLAIEGITSFSVAPLRWGMLVGMATALCGLTYCAWIVLKAATMGDPVAGYPSLIAAVTFLGGIQLIFTGIVGEYVGKIYKETKQRPLYLIAEVIAKQPIANQTPERADYAS